MHVEKKDVADVFKLLIIELLKKMGWVTEEKKEQIEKMVESFDKNIKLAEETDKAFIEAQVLAKQLCPNCQKNFSNYVNYSEKYHWREFEN